MGNVPIRAGRRVVCKSPFRCGDCSVVCSVVLEFQAELPRLVSHIGSLTAAVGSTLRDDRRGPLFLAVEVPDGVVTPEVRVTRALDRKRWGHSTRSHFTFPPHRSGNVCGEVLVDPMWPPVCTCPGRSGAISQTPHPNAGSGPVNHRTQQHRGRRPPTPPCRSTICRRQRPLPLDQSTITLIRPALYCTAIRVLRGSPLLLTEFRSQFADGRMAVQGISSEYPC
jgi:hypothetical protein